PPSPSHILRTQASPITSLSISADNERIYSGDASGVVVVTSSRSFRALTTWKAHTDGLLGLQEWGNQIITHGRDNKLHVWDRVQESQRIGSSAVSPGLPTPTLRYSMDVNALNYCRFSLLPVNVPGLPTSALLALPNLIESSEADIWALPSCDRIHAAIGKGKDSAIFSPDGRGGANKQGIIMALHLYSAEREQASTSSQAELRLLCAYENGSVALRRFARTDKLTSVEGIGWEVIWSVRLHVEAIMAMTVSSDNSLALTVSADHLIGRYDLTIFGLQVASAAGCTAHRTKHPQNACIAMRDDAKVCAVGGWDGRIRLYSTRTFRALGTLKYHKTICHALQFAKTLSVEPAEDSDDEMTEQEKQDRTRWLLSGSKDNRCAIWTLMSFEKP
ncbi:WD-40 repeat-containing protein, partial [Mycena floridula]